MSPFLAGWACNVLFASAASQQLAGGSNFINLELSIQIAKVAAAILDPL